MEIYNILTDVQYTTTKELYTAMLKKTNKDVLCKAKWQNLFGNNINWKTIWKTIHSGLIANWDFDVIYKLIHKVIAVRKNLHYWRIVSSPCVSNAAARTQSCTLFSTARKQNNLLNRRSLYSKNSLANISNSMHSKLPLECNIKLAIMRQN